MPQYAVTVTDLWEPITQDTEKIFCPPKEMSKAQTKKKHNFWKVVISNSIPDELRNLHTSRYKKNLAINLTRGGYGNRQNVIRLARENNSDLLRALKHLMETKL